MFHWKTRGQDHLVQALGRSLQQDRLSHAYLLVGPPQVGKGTLALDLARAVNCLAGQDRPCSECQQCRRIQDGIHADVQVVALETDDRTDRLRMEITIDQIRAMEQAVTLKPYEGACRVVIIDSAEHLNQFAANALLKTVEEPPPQVLLLLLTANEEAMPPTLRSRCQRLELRPLSQEAVAGLLVEEHGLPPERAHLLARLSGGRLGWALAAASDFSIMDDRTQQLQRLQDVIGGGLEARFQYAAQLATQFGRDREAVWRALGLWLQWWRDTLVIQEGSLDLVVNIDYRDALEQTAQRLSTADTVFAVKELVATLRRLEQNASPRLALEALMLALPRVQVSAAR